jgi:hypothetical protein
VGRYPPTRASLASQFPSLVGTKDRNPEKISKRLLAPTVLKTSGSV